MEIKFNKLDSREFIIKDLGRYTITLYQVEILRLINILETMNSHNLAKKLKLIIYLRDIKEDTFTDFERDLPKGDITKEIYSPRARIEETSVRRQLIENMGEFYNPTEN